MHRLLSLIGESDWAEPFREELGKAGWELVSVATAAAAEKQLSLGDVSAMFLEKGVLRGGEAVKFRTALGQLPRIVISRDDSYRGVAQWLKQRVGAHVRLPVSGPELVDVVSRVLAHAALGQERLALVERARQQKRQMTTLEEMTRALTSTQDNEAILDMIMEKATAITKAEAWSLLLLDDETGELVFERVWGGASTTLKEKRISRDEGIVGWVAREGKGTIVNDVKNDTRFLPRVDRVTGFQTHNLMCVPIISKGRVTGVLEVINKQGGDRFTEDDLEIMGGFVDHAALALELSELYQKMAEMAITDDLTNLFNMRYLSRTIETEIERGNRYGTAVSLIFMDMDHFKDINDNHGHLVGSKLLVEVAQLLLGSLRAVDIVARYGGDEFVMVLPQTASRDAFMIAERIRSSVEKHVFLKADTGGIRLTASLGVATYPDTAKTREELMRMADEAMYHAKNKSRNAVYEMTCSG